MAFPRGLQMPNAPGLSLPALALNRNCWCRRCVSTSFFHSARTQAHHAMAAPPAAATIDQLFRLVDQDSDGHLNFGEVTLLFKQLAPQQSTQSAVNAAVEALLLADRNTDSALSRREFELMLTKVAELSGVPLQEAAQRLLDATQQHHQHQQLGQQTQHTQQQQQQPTDAAVDSGAVLDQAPPPPIQQAAAAAATPAVAPTSSSQAVGTAAAAAAVQDEARLRPLFQLWDKAGDGHISFAELCQGLGKMRQPLKHKKDVTSLISEAGSVLAAHDADGDRQLDLQEFSSFMVKFMGAAGFSLHDVLDDLITLAQSKPDNEKLQKVLDNAQPQIQRMLSQ